MPRKWKDYRSWEAHERRADQLRSLERIKKAQRSNRGRTVDDWLIDADPRDPSWKVKERALLDGGCRWGRVIEVHKRSAYVAEEPELGQPDTGLLWLCSIAKRHFQRSHRERNFVVVGDRVLIEPDVALQFDEDGEPLDTDLPRGVIQHAYVRHSKVSRRDPLRKEWEHVMLANIDQVVIVASVLHPQVRWGLIDRFLVQAALENLPAYIVLNKVDLLDDPDLASEEFVAAYRRRVEIYRAVGYPIFEISALRPGKFKKVRAELQKLFKGKLTGLCGHSGVGKSSIVNLMRPEIVQEVDENPDIFYKGRHTTTYNSLLRLGIGGYAIDTPGIRSFAIGELDPITLSACFPEFAPFKCKFRECSHDKEDDCAIKAAVERGEISRERYRSYVGLLIGVSFREGEGDATHAELIADLEARRLSVDDPELLGLAADEPLLDDPSREASDEEERGDRDS